MSCTREWIINKSDEKKPLIDRLLEVRGIKTESAKYEFLHPLEITLTHPNAFCDMPKAVDRIVKAIDNKEKILIYGDFDADGVTSTSVLLKTFRYLGGEVDYYIPNRDSEGHGMNKETLEMLLDEQKEEKPDLPAEQSSHNVMDKETLTKLIIQKKSKLIITVDNGISNFEEVGYINSFGRDVIITDHHEAPEKLPPAYAIINPKAMNSLSEKLSATQIEYLTSLAGVGVAYKVALGVLERYGKLDYGTELLPYVTVGTIADVVPLIGENRFFVTKGLELIAEGKHYGLTRMLKNAGVNTENGLTAEQIAFTVAPRINAWGRLEPPKSENNTSEQIAPSLQTNKPEKLDTKSTAVEFMTSESPTEVNIALQTLEYYNKMRQNRCTETFEEADKMWKATGMRDNAIVLFNKEWSVGIVGIVASRFVDKYYKPAFIVTYSDQTKQLRCSARGINELNIYEILSNISEYLDSYGGHKFAGGFSFSEEKASFETVKKALNQTVDEMLNGKKLIPSLNIDLELDIKDVDDSLVEEIKKLEPFGASNPSPTFVTKDLIIKQKKLMGSNGEHLKLIIATPNGDKDCIWWSKGDLTLSAGDKIDIAFTPQLNTYNNVTNIQLVLKDIHSDALEEEESVSVKIFDDRKKTDVLATVEDLIKNSKSGVSVFVEDRKIMEELKPYQNIQKHVVNRLNADKNEGLIFFDYPCDDEVYEKLKQKVCATSIYYEYYQNYKPDEKGVLESFTGMINYSCNKLDGNFALERAASKLGVTEEVIEILLEICNDCGMIKIISQNETSYKIAFLEKVEFSKLLNSPKYAEFSGLMKKINEYKNSFMTAEL